MPYLEELVSKTKAEKKGIEGIGLVPGETAAPIEAAKPPAREEEKILVEKYGDVRIYKVKGEALYRYEVPTPHYRGEEKALITALIEIASKVISPEREAGKTIEQRKFSYMQRILDIIDSSPELRVPPAAKEFYAEAVSREMVGWGLIDPLLHDDNLEDILVIGPNQPVYVFHRKYDMMKTNIIFYDDKDIKDLIDRIARNIGRHIDIQSPLLDARLPDGTRVNATVPPASVKGSTLSIRKFRQDPITIIDLVNFGTLNYDAAAFLWLATDGFGAKPANIVISGGTASGKTTTLNCLASFIPNNERIITIEDSVCGDERVWIVCHGIPCLKPIAEVVDSAMAEYGSVQTASGHEICFNPEGLKTYCFNSRGKVVEKTISSLVRHKTSKPVYRITTRSGRKISVTEDHSLFTLGTTGVECIATRDVAPGTLIAAPRRLPESTQKTEQINLLKHVKNFGRGCVEGKTVSEKLSALPLEKLVFLTNAKTRAGARATARRWKKKGVLSFHAFAKLFEEKIFGEADAFSLSLRPNASQKRVPAVLQVDSDFLCFAGLWLASGCYDKNSVVVAAGSEDETAAVVKKIAERFGASCKPLKDASILRVNSLLLKKIMQFSLGLTGNAYSKKMPPWIHSLSAHQLKPLLKGYFSGSGTAAKQGIEWTTRSPQLLEDIQTSLLRLGITSQTRATASPKDKACKGSISSPENISRFFQEIGFLQAEKNARVNEIALQNRATDLILLPRATIAQHAELQNTGGAYSNGKTRFARRFVQLAASTGFLVESDFFWDEVRSVEKLPAEERMVYDLSVSEHENFVCSNLFVHNTAELNLPLEHWVRFETRPPGLEGMGEITMDMLVKNSLRMRPDRIIVGEIRGEEGHTLFSAMNTGHDGVEMATEQVYLASGEIKEAEALFSEHYSPDAVVKEGNFEYISLSNGPSVCALDKQTLKLVHKPILRVWRRPKKEGEKAFQIITSGKREIVLSHDHPVYRINAEGLLEQVHASELREGDRIATPKTIETVSKKVSANFSHQRKNAAKLEEVNENIAYCLGVLLGDGHLSEKTTSIDVDDRSVIDAFTEKMREFTDAEMHAKYLTDRNCWRLTNGCASLPQLFNKVFEVPFGNKTKRFTIPQKILASRNTVVAAFLRGMFDCKAFVGNKRQGIVLTLSNKKAVSQIKHLLLRFGIQSRLYEQEKDGRGNTGPYYRLTIYDKHSVLAFAKEINFSHAKKKKTLERLVSAVSEANENTNVDLIPAAALIRKTRNALSLTQKELSVSAGFGKTRTVIRSYECGQRTPSSAALKQISAALVEKFNERTHQLKQGFGEIERIADEWLQNPRKAAGKTIALLKRMRVNTSLFEERSRIGRACLYHYANGTLRPTRKQTRAMCAALSELIMQINFELSDCKKIILHLQALANSDVVFEKIVSVKESAPTPFLYDLTVEDCHTYLSGTNGGIFISNCMGTLHANSAKETLIRLANPPINVPLIMLQSLNFIVMQQRINDRRKGLIRRITEIAEIISVEENQMPKLQFLYQWDPAKDVLASTGMNSLYLQTLGRYTGFSKETLLEELNTRAKILQELNNRNVRSLKEVCSVTQNYILRTRGKI